VIAVRPAPEQGQALHAEILASLPEFWGDRDVRNLHQPVWLRQFADDAVVVRDGEVLLGYLLGVVTAGRLAYVQAVATRLPARGRGVGRLLYDTFLDSARAQGARRVEAVTTPANAGSVAFHRRLGFTAEPVADYAGPGHERVLFSLALTPLQGRRTPRGEVGATDESGPPASGPMYRRRPPSPRR